MFRVYGGKGIYSGEREKLSVLGSPPYPDTGPDGV